MTREERIAAGWKSVAVMGKFGHRLMEEGSFTSMVESRNESIEVGPDQTPPLNWKMYGIRYWEAGAMGHGWYLDPPRVPGYGPWMPLGKS